MRECILIEILIHTTEDEIHGGAMLFVFDKKTDYHDEAKPHYLVAAVVNISVLAYCVTAGARLDPLRHGL